MVWEPEGTDHERQERIVLSKLYVRSRINLGNPEEVHQYCMRLRFQATVSQESSTTSGRRALALSLQRVEQSFHEGLETKITIFATQAIES